MSNIATFEDTLILIEFFHELSELFTNISGWKSVRTLLKQPSKLESLLKLTKASLTFGEFWGIGNRDFGYDFEPFFCYSVDLAVIG